MYLSDLLLGCWVLIIAKSQEERRKFIAFLGDQKLVLLPVLLFVLWSLLANAFLDIDLVAAIYRWAKLTEMFLLVFLIGWWVSVDKERSFRIFKYIAWGMWPLCLIALLEVVKQQSLGLQLLGEWQFTVKTPGIATFYWLGRDWLRPYSTFPHPNVLGGILSIMLPVIVWFKKRFNQRLFIVLWGVLVLTLLSTFSRTGWTTFFVLMLVLAFYLVRSNQLVVSTEGFKIIILLTFLTSLFFWFVPNPVTERFYNLFTIDRISLLRRQELATLSWQLVRGQPVFGIGMNQFSFEVERAGKIIGSFLWAQPVHNVWLLIVVEHGIIGFGLFFWFVSVLFRRILKTLSDQPASRRKVYLFLPIIGLLLTSMVDHYWWTLQPGIMFLGVILGVCLGESAESKRLSLPRELLLLDRIRRFGREQ